MPRQAVDISGKKFGRLTVIKRDTNIHKKDPWWICKCSCGNIGSFRGQKMKEGTTSSCGCYQIETTIARSRTHGMTGTKIFRKWLGMKRRCYNKAASDYKNYGGRGIGICEEWRNSFENFYRDMGDIPPGKTLDRIDNNKDYSKENCRWSSVKEQNRNKSTTLLVCGMSAAEYAEKHGINYNTLLSRIRRKKILHAWNGTP